MLLLALIVPQVVFGAWWNPFSWKVFKKSSRTQVNSVLVATSTGFIGEIEKLRAEVEELKNKEVTSNKGNSSRENSTQSSDSNPSSPEIISITQKGNEKVLYADVVEKYTNFQSSIIFEKSGLKKNSQLYTERQYFTYLNDLLNRITADTGYLASIKYSNPRPVNIEEIYISKFNKLKIEYNTEVKKYLLNKEKDILETEAARVQSNKEAEQNTILEKEKLVRDIKVKIAEMDLIRIQIDTLAGASLIDILNQTKKIDGEALFYSFKYDWRSGNGSFDFPYSRNACVGGCIQEIKSGLQAIVANYRAFLYVELAKNQ